MSVPNDLGDRGLEANVSAISDEQWLEGHRQLVATGDIPEEELAYLYDPDRPPATVEPEDLNTRPDPAEFDG